MTAYSITDQIYEWELRNMGRGQTNIIAVANALRAMASDGWETRIASSVTELPAAAARPATTPRAARDDLAAATAPLVEVELRRDLGRNRVVLSKSARALISDECSRYDKRECGGWLIGPRPKPGEPIYVSTAGGAATDHKPDSVVLKIDEFDQDAETIARQCGDHLKLLGSWHSHPSGENIPSPTDLGVYARQLERSGLPSYLGVIVSEHRRWRTWDMPVVFGWLTTRDQRGRLVCERATLD